MQWGAALPFAVALLVSGITGMGMATVSQTQHWVVGTESTPNSSVSEQTGSAKEELTLSDHILKSLVQLALATGLVSKAIALMPKGMAALTHWIALHLLALDMHRSVRNVREQTGN